MNFLNPVRMLLAGFLMCSLADGVSARFQIAPFETDVTPPIGHPLLASMCPPAKAIEAKLWAKGVVLSGGEKPVVLVSVDWCEIRNDAYDRWREVLADAAGTSRERVFLSAIHQHDTPLADLTAQRILADRGVTTNVVNPRFHERVVQRVATSIRRAKRQPITHIGTGQAQVERIASNRRYPGPDGKPRYDRGSATRNVFAKEAPEGTIDPNAKALSFWNGTEAVAVLYSYATHPMSFYRTGHVNPDFPGIARDRLQKEFPNALQIYFSGAAGNVTAGKYNDGKPPARTELADRLYQGLKSAWIDTTKNPIKEITFRSAPLSFKPRETGGYSRSDLEKKLATAKRARDLSHAAMGLSWRERADERKQPIDVPVLDLGSTAFVLLPGESYIEYQLYAQSVRPDDFVMVGAYGESAPGYIPLEMHWREKDSNLNSWCWVAEGSEKTFKSAIKKALIGTK